jgi:hypothetical protein
MKQKGRFTRKLYAAAICCSLLLTAASPAPARADAIWDRWVAAEAAVKQGNPAAAVPHWEFLVKHYEQLGDYQGAALFSGSLNEYYDSIKEYDKAIEYYELENKFWLLHGKDWGAVDLIRAEQIRTTIDLYMSTDEEEELKRQAAPKNGKLAKFEPEYGTYIGLYSEQDPKMLNFFTRSEQFYDKKHALYLTYGPVSKDFPTQFANRAKEAGAAIQIAWEPSQGLDAVTEDVVRSFAKGAKASGIPIFLRYASEMNGNWVPWHGDPQKYIEKFRMVHRIMAEEAPNVAMVWSPGDVPMYSMDAYYPGDDVVDWVGVSLYSEPYENGDPAQGNMQATSPVERLDYLYKTYADRKPLMISETAVSHYAHIPQESFTEYGTLNLQRLYDIMPKKYPRLKSITYFNVNLADRESRNNYLLRDNERMYELYRNLIASPYYLTKVENNAKPADRIGHVKVTDGLAFAKQTKLTPFVKIPDIYIGKLEYYLNGELLETQTKPPYGIDLKAGSVPENSQIELAVYNHDGRKVGSKSFTLSSEVSVAIDNKLQSYEQPPVIREGSTLAPLRAIFEAMGAVVEWDPTSKTATAKKGDTTVTIQIGNPIAEKNGQKVTLDMAAQLVNGYTMAPARFVAEAFGGKVGWDATTRTVQITTNGNTAALPHSSTQQTTAQPSEPADEQKPDSTQESGWRSKLQTIASAASGLFHRVKTWITAKL